MPDPLSQVGQGLTAANTAMYGGSGVTFLAAFKQWLAMPGNVELTNFGFMALGAIVALVGLFFNVRAANARRAVAEHLKTTGHFQDCNNCPYDRRKIPRI